MGEAKWIGGLWKKKNEFDLQSEWKEDRRGGRDGEIWPESMKVLSVRGEVKNDTSGTKR